MTSIGQPKVRVDGGLKVTGVARYTGDVPLSDALHGVIVHSVIASGRTRSIDVTAALRSPGVRRIYTWRDFPRAKFPVPWDHGKPHGQGYMPLQDDRVLYAGQPIALVVANSVDEASLAGTLIRVDYEEHPAIVFDAASLKTAYVPPQFLFVVATSVGDADNGLANAAFRIDQTYTTSDRHHNPMEPHHTLATWAPDGTLTLFETTQFVDGCRELMAAILGTPTAKITVVSQFLGGGFGGKAWAWPHTVMAALVAKDLKKPVRIELTRAQMYSMTGHQPATIQTIALGSDKDGNITGIRHECTSPTSMFDGYIEYGAAASRSLWKSRDGISTNHRIVNVNRNTPTPMRPPAEGVGHFAIETAMDELAYAAGIDPVELRLRNDTMTDPLSGRPFSTRNIRKCLELGGERFGWAKRDPKPRSMRDGNFLIGQGVACAAYTHWKFPAKARVTVSADGKGTIEAAMHDIGTGTYTVMRQIAADGLGVEPERLVVRLGDTRLPDSPPAFGSATVPNAGAAVMLAAQSVRAKLIALAISGVDAPFANADPSSISIASGRLAHSATGRSIDIPDLLARNGLKAVVGEGDYKPQDESSGARAVLTFSAVFAEVRVDPDLGVVRLSRFVGAYDAGRIINPRTARSQAIGGIIWGTGQALTETSAVDPHTGRFVNRNMSGYLLPTNADIPELDVIFAGEFDPDASLLGSKGIGEVTAVSVSAAIGNAVYHATGKRIRELPITIEDLL